MSEGFIIEDVDPRDNKLAALQRMAHFTAVTTEIFNAEEQRTQMLLRLLCVLCVSALKNKRNLHVQLRSA